MSIQLSDIYRARENISEIACRTPLVPAWSLSDRNRNVLLKLEIAQPTGAFKLRGAANALSNLPTEQSINGVVCVSTGNHGRAVAYAARRSDIRAYVCMSTLAPKNKIESIESVGGTVRIVGDNQDQAQQEVDRLVHEDGMIEIPPFDHVDVIAGQGTIGIELVE